MDDHLPYRDPIERRRGSAIQLASLLSPLVSVPFQVLHASSGRWHLVAAHWVGLACAATMYWLVSRGRVTAAAWLAIVSLLIVVVYTSWHGGGIVGHAAPFLCMVAMLAAVTLDGSQRIAGIALAVIAVIGLGVAAPVRQIPEPVMRGSAFALVAGVGLITVLMNASMERLAARAATAREAAERANADKDRLLARTSHHLRTPLNAIVGYTELLADDARDEGRPAVRDMERILLASHGLLSILDDILDVARMESGDLLITHGLIDFDALISQLSAAVGPLAEARHDRFEVELEPVPFEVWLDEGRLRQVLLNLLGNACKFTERGEVRLRVAPSGADTVRFEVVDTGVGMSEAQQQLALRPFEQAAVSREYGGHGLGLAICVRLVEAMGGEIGLHSAPGEGTTVWTELPARKAS